MLGVLHEGLEELSAGRRDVEGVVVLEKVQVLFKCGDKEFYVGVALGTVGHL